MSDKPEIRPTVVPAAILTLTQGDANEISSKCPYEAVPDHDNVLYVFPSALDAEAIQSRKAKVGVTHLVKNKESGQNEVKGEWEVTVPINQTVNKNVFYVDIKV